MSGFQHGERFYTAQNPERAQISNNPSLLLIMNLPHFRFFFFFHVQGPERMLRIHCSLKAYCARPIF